MTAPPAPQRGTPYSIYLAPDGGLSRDLPPTRLLAAVREGGQLWVDIDATDPPQHALLEKVFHYHHLAIEDTLSPRTRVKLEEFPDYLFLVIRAIAFDGSTPDPYDIETANLYCFLGGNALVTVHAEPSPAVSELKQRLERSPDVLNRGVEMVLHGVVDHTVDEYLPLVDRVDDLVDELEERIFDKFDESAIHEIFRLKRLVVQIRRHLGPLREVLNILTNRPQACIAPASQVYFRDVYDHTIRIVESVESTRDLLTGVLDAYLSQASNRLNRSMKSLSAVATIALPLVVIGGMFGMNFVNIPLSHHPFGFFIAVGTMALLALVMRWYLKKRGWV
jgi:magnesium transporter